MKLRHLQIAFVLSGVSAFAATEAMPAEHQAQPRWLALDNAEAKSEGGAKVARQTDESYLASGTNVGHDTYTFTVRAPVTGMTAVKLEAIADASLVRSGPGRASNGNFALSTIEMSVAPPAGAVVKAKFVKALLKS